MTTNRNLRETLRSLLQESSLISETLRDSYSVGGRVPAVCAFPFNEYEMGNVLQLAAKDQLTVIARGNGNLMELGNIPESLDIILGTGNLHPTIDHTPGDLTVTVSSSTRVGDIQSSLSEYDQWLPIDPPLTNNRTIGGVLATNLIGPLSISYGTTRDLLIGVRILGADGVITKSGGKVVKNVSGFDVGKVHLGAMGTLGIILEASFKVWPKPQIDITMIAPFNSLHSAISGCHDLLANPIAPQSAEIVIDTDKSSCTVHTRFLGKAAGMGRRLREATTILKHTGASKSEILEGAAATTIWENASDFGWKENNNDIILMRLGCLPSLTSELTKKLVSLVNQSQQHMRLLVSPGNGVLRCVLSSNGTKEIIENIRSATSELGGYAIIERCPLTLKSDIEIWGTPRETLELMQRLKAQMDPQRILSPGRFIGGI